MDNKLTNINSAISAPLEADLLRIRKDSATFPRLRNIPEAEATAALYRLITQAMLYRGQKADESFVRFTAAALLGEMLADTHGCGLAEITLQEIAFAVRRAVLTEDLYGVNVATLYRAIVRYAKNDGAKLEAVRPITPDQLATIKAAYAGQMMKQVK